MSENTRLAVQVYTVETLRDERDFLMRQLQSSHENTAAIKREVSDLKHQVECEKVLRDQFKSFVKTNMDVFDCCSEGEGAN